MIALNIDMARFLPQLLGNFNGSCYKVRETSSTTLEIILDKYWHPNGAFHSHLIVTQNGEDFKVSDTGALSGDINYTFGANVFQQTLDCLVKARQFEPHDFKKGVYQHHCNNLNSLVNIIDIYFCKEIAIWNAAALSHQIGKDLISNAQHGHSVKQQAKHLAAPQSASASSSVSAVPQASSLSSNSVSASSLSPDQKPSERASHDDSVMESLKSSAMSSLASAEFHKPQPSANAGSAHVTSSESAYYQSLSQHSGLQASQLSSSNSSSSSSSVSSSSSASASSVTASNSASSSVDTSEVIPQPKAFDHRLTQEEFRHYLIVYAHQTTVKSTAQLNRRFPVSLARAKRGYQYLVDQHLARPKMTQKRVNQLALNYAKQHAVKSAAQLSKLLHVSYPRAMDAFSILENRGLSFTPERFKTDAIAYAKAVPVTSLVQLMKHFHASYQKTKPVFDNLKAKGLIKK